CGVRRVDALLYTHAHSDHVCGLDDVRRFCEIQRQTIPVYAAATTLRALSRSFAYIHRTPRPGLSYPRVDFRPAARPFRIGRICVTPLPVEHAGIVTQGYRVAAGGAYLPDCHTLPAATMQRLKHLDVLILDALRRTPHPTHLSLDECVSIMRRLRPRRGYITHMGHDLEYTRTQRSLPSGMHVPWDGLTLRLKPVTVKK
ncbi:MAG: MBL fold metallo-hydrolase, partial [Kiritimatiellia bacterium]